MDFSSLTQTMDEYNASNRSTDSHTTLQYLTMHSNCTNSIKSKHIVLINNETVNEMAFSSIVKVALALIITYRDYCGNADKKLPINTVLHFFNDKHWEMNATLV